MLLLSLTWRARFLPHIELLNISPPKGKVRKAGLRVDEIHLHRKLIVDPFLDKVKREKGWEQLGRKVSEIEERFLFPNWKGGEVVVQFLKVKSITIIIVFLMK